MLIFENILNDVFYGVTESVTITATSPRRKRQPHPPSKSPNKPVTTQSTQGPVSTPSNRQHATPVKHTFIEPGIDMIIAKQAIILGFEPGPAWSQKVLQLYTITQVKHGVYMCVCLCVCVCVCVCLCLCVCAA